MFAVKPKVVTFVGKNCSNILKLESHEKETLPSQCIGLNHSYLIIPSNRENKQTRRKNKVRIDTAGLLMDFFICAVY